ncbi:hypothetical protein [Aquimarina brevivitae]|uniref:hypothetical protein n=1 Tax=Aquimarina brevivitae TaxID=323412 RepID=UPI001028C839|nr:hypothetical protein [Aquimarina brevivitae]
MSLVFLFIALFCVCCKREQQSAPLAIKDIQGEWLRAAWEFDENFYKPSIAIMEFTEDSCFIKNVKDSVVSVHPFTVDKDSVHFGDWTFSRDKFKLRQNALYLDRLIAGRPKNVKLNVDHKEIETILKSSDWKDSSATYRFTDNQKILVAKNGGEGFLQYCYDILEYQDKFFLSKKGNQLDCNRDYQFLEQIIAIKESQIETYGFANGEFKTRVYSKKLKEETLFNKPTNFQLCNPYLNKNFPLDRYYYKGTEFKGGLYHIRKIVAEQYKAPSNSKESGIVQVRFVVNCEGKAGLFENQAFDFDYKLKEFSDSIVSQIVTIVKSLQDWNPGRNKKGEVIDTYKYLNFRIEHGKITRIYP